MIVQLSVLKKELKPETHIRVDTLLFTHKHISGRRLSIYIYMQKNTNTHIQTHSIHHINIYPTYTIYMHLLFIPHHMPDKIYQYNVHINSGKICQLCKHCLQNKICILLMKIVSRMLNK